MKKNLNYLKLRHLIEEKGLENIDLAAKIGVSQNTISKRLCRDESDGTWKNREIVGICKVLHIPQEQIGEYFFPKVEKGESV